MGIDQLSQGGSVRDIDGDGIAELLQSVDGQGNDISNLGLLSTGEVDITGLSTGQIHPIESANINDKKEYQRAIQYTDVTASTATNIFKASNLAESDVQLLELMVSGTDQTANSRNFFDRVAFAFGDSTNVTELATSATPPSRSYAVVNDVDLELTISDGYDVVVKGELYNVSF